MSGVPHPGYFSSSTHLPANFIMSFFFVTNYDQSCLFAMNNQVQFCMEFSCGTIQLCSKIIMSFLTVE